MITHISYLNPVLFPFFCLSLCFLSPSLSLFLSLSHCLSLSVFLSVSLPHVCMCVCVCKYVHALVGWLNLCSRSVESTLWCHFSGPLNLYFLQRSPRWFGIWITQQMSLLILTSLNLPLFVSLVSCLWIFNNPLPHYSELYPLAW